MNKENARDYLPLVQALADGRVIQVSSGGEFHDVAGGVTFALPARNYRIKPEPREIFFVEFCTGNRGPYATIEIAQQAYPRCKVKRYREVIE